MYVHVWEHRNPKRDGPVIHPRTVNKEFSPLEHPKTYRQEFLKSVVLFMAVMPLVERGLVTLFPDPCNFDFHLRDQMFAMAKFRAQGMKVDPKEEAGFMEMMKEEHKRSMLLLPRDALRRQVVRQSPELDERAINAVLDGFDRLREQDPLAVLQEGSLEGGKGGGQLTPFKMAPNFEITMYLAQATGSCIVTDSLARWRELLAVARHTTEGDQPLIRLRTSIEKAEFHLPCDPSQITTLADQRRFSGYPVIMRKVHKYLSKFQLRGLKPNLEDSLNAEFMRVYAATRTYAKASGISTSQMHASCLSPAGGIQDNSVSRLLLMSNSEQHFDNVPIAWFFRQTP